MFWFALIDFLSNILTDFLNDFASIGNVVISFGGCINILAGFWNVLICLDFFLQYFSWFGKF